MSTARELVPRFIYNAIKKKYNFRLSLERFALWFVATLFFMGILYFGSIELSNQSTLYFRERAEPFFERAFRTTVVIVATLCAILLATSLLVCITFFHRRFYRRLVASRNRALQIVRICDFLVAWLLSWIPIIISAIPPFITAIFFIIYLHLNTLESSNLAYVILCLLLFNLPYSYTRSIRKIQQAYQFPSVLFAQSIGIPSYTIFRRYVMPGIVRDYCTMLRELLPHLLIESVILEYTFNYYALMRSTIDSITQNRWYDFFLFAYGLILFVSFFDLLFRELENFFDHPKAAE